MREPGHLIATTACLGGELSSCIIEMERARHIGDTNTETIKYTVTKLSPKLEKYHNQFIEQEPAYYKTTRDNVVLRNTPIDKGMNRLGYLPADTKVVVDGITNEFSRIYLTKDKHAWAFTKDLIKIETATEENEKNEFTYTPQNITDISQIKNEKEILI